MQVFDSNGPDVRIRGTAYQVFEKYTTLARDAASAGDRVLAESYLQYAEHYQRIIGRFESENPTQIPRPIEGADRTENSSGNGEDLSLPASVLGAAAKVETTARTPATVE
jgi:hypothetical protein